MQKPAIVIFFNDWKVYPGGINAGGGESSTVAIARSFARAGHRVIACANLPEGETKNNGIEYWNFGADYRIHEITERLSEIGPFHCLCATLVHPFLFVRALTNCLSRIVINHAPTALASGLEPATVMEVIDAMTCVSHAQRSLVLGRGAKPEKIHVVKNGFDPEVFPYEGPENRDFNKLIFIGRVEAPKGIHVLVQAYGELKKAFPALSLDIFGDESYWPEFIAKKNEIETTLPGIKFRGKVPQAELSKNLRKAGLLVFPSISFESAGLSVVDAQASGCPVVGFGVGGVPEYLQDGVCGEVIYDKTPESLYKVIHKLLSNPQRLREMSIACKTAGRSHSWDNAAIDILKLAEGARQSKDLNISISLQRTAACSLQDPNVLLDDHQKIGAGEVISDEEISNKILGTPKSSTAFLWRGLRSEALGVKKAALSDYVESAKYASEDDWQPFFRLALLTAEQSDLKSAATYAVEVLKRKPNFPLKDNLNKIIEFAKE